MLTSLLWRHAVHDRLVRRDITDTEVRALTRRLTPGMAGHLVMNILGLFIPVLALVGYLAIAMIIIVPADALRRGRNRT